MRHNQIKISKNGILYILLFQVAFLRQSELFSMYYLTAVFVSLTFILLGIIKCYRTRRAVFDKEIFRVGKWLLFPWLIFLVNNIFIYSIGCGESQFLKSSFVQIFITPIVLMGAFSYYYLTKKNALKYFVYAIIVHFIILQIIMLIRMGISDYFSGILTVFHGNSIGNPFEKNSDLVLALGLLVIYYCDKFVKVKEKNSGRALLVLIFVFLGGKRISFLALLIIGLFFILSNFMSYRNKIKVETAVSIVGIVSSLLFVYLVISHYLSLFLFNHGINTMGRMRMYDYIAQYGNLSIMFHGHGFSFCNLILEKDRVLTYNGVIAGLHSDVLRVFFEMGTIVFVFWLIYVLLVLPRKMTATYGKKVGNLFWFLTIYVFITYLTDNTMNYFITQTLFVILMMNSIGIERRLYDGS